MCHITHGTPPLGTPPHRPDPTNWDTILRDALVAHGGVDPSFCDAACSALDSLADASPVGLAAVRAAGPLAVARPLVAAIPADHDWIEEAKDSLADLEETLADE